MSRGKRYNHEPKLNIKKVIAAILMVIVIITFVIAIKKLATSDNTKEMRVKEYYAFYQENKWGVIDSKAKVVIKPIFSEPIIIPDHTKDIFICTENVDYENGIYTSKILNAKNKEILKQYKKVQAIENYDENNNLWYEENVLAYQNDQNLYGLIDFKGKILVEPIYDEITSLKGTKGAILIKKDNKVGLVSTSGTTIIPSEYQSIRSLGENTNLYIVENENQQYGIYGVLDEKYQEIKPLGSKEYFCVKENNQYKLINQENEDLMTQKFDTIMQIKDSIIVYKKDNYYQAYDLESKTTFKNKYDEIQYTSDQYFIVKKKNVYGIIDLEENVKEKIEYANIHYDTTSGIYELEEKNNTSGMNKILNQKLQLITQGILEEVNINRTYLKVWTENGYQYYNLDGEIKNVNEVLLQNSLFLKKENGKYGFVNKEGNTVVECIYDDAKEQNSFGYAAVKKDGKWGAIDATGAIVGEIDNTLEDYLLVDFIGEYHLGKDINLMYYTK